MTCISLDTALIASLDKITTRLFSFTLVDACFKKILYKQKLICERVFEIITAVPSQRRVGLSRKKLIEINQLRKKAINNCRSTN